MKSYLRHSTRLAGACGLALLFIRFPATADSSPSLAAEIQKTSVLYQRLVWVGDTPPSDQDNQILVDDLNAIKARRKLDSVAGLEAFIASHTNSPWNPSLQANLGRFYFEHGCYTEAVRNWEAAWAATKAAKDGSAKQVADFTFAYWTKLLVGVGQVNTLRALLEETQGRTFEALPLRLIVNNTRNECKQMISGTDGSFRCGSIALNDMLGALNLPSLDLTKIRTAASPVTGFSMGKLVELAGKSGVAVVAAQWGPGQTPVVPSVVHWKQDHYAAILAYRNGVYQVRDLAHGSAIWMSAGDIQAEASGYFIVPKEKLPNDWILLTKVEADQIYGRGYVSGAPDGPDGCGNGSGGGSGGGPGAGPGHGSGGGLGGGGPVPFDGSSN